MLAQGEEKETLIGLRGREGDVMSLNWSHLGRGAEQRGHLANDANFWQLALLFLFLLFLSPCFFLEVHTGKAEIKERQFELKNVKNVNLINFFVLFCCYLCAVQLCFVMMILHNIFIVYCREKYLGDNALNYALLQFCNDQIQIFLVMFFLFFLI